MEVDYAARRRIAVFLLIAFSLSSNLLSSLKAFRSGLERAGRDDTSEVEERFAEIKGTLPRYGVVGYTSDRVVLMDDRSWHDPANEEAWRESRRVQYALAPVLVDLSQPYPLVVGNFRDAGAARASLGSSRLVPLRDFNNGIVLFADNQK